MVSFTYVDTKDALYEAVREWNSAADLAVDLECENNLHHYGAYITLIQISSLDKIWIIDVLVMKEIQPLADIFENKNIQKIFHDVSFDFRILHEQFSCRPRNVFDTQLAALLLGKKQLGLGDLLREYFSIEKERKYQMADWTKRPLDTKMLSYAAKDTQYLIQLRDIFKKELQQKGRWSWAEEEFAVLERADFSYNEQAFIDVRGVKVFSPGQLGIFKKLFLLRQKLAKRVDRPSHFIINNNHLRECSLHPPQWENLRGVHPIVRKEAAQFYAAVEEGNREPVDIQIKEKKRYSQQQKDLFEQLNELQLKAADKIGIKGHLIINKEQMSEIASANKTDCLRKWQRQLLAEEGLKL
ncbi:MAG: HRDC domain-containing protein [Nanoarchaeota archaeon]